MGGNNLRFLQRSCIRDKKTSRGTRFIGTLKERIINSKLNNHSIPAGLRGNEKHFHYGRIIYK